jgi:hypothetical protein
VNRLVGSRLLLDAGQCTYFSAQGVCSKLMIHALVSYAQHMLIDREESSEDSDLR